LLNQITDPLAYFIGDGAYDQTCIDDAIAKRDPDAEVIIPPRSTAVPSDPAESAPTQHDRHLQSMAEYGRMGWQRRPRYTRRTLVEAAISWLKRRLEMAYARGRNTAVPRKAPLQFMP
jgi:hypothetical protein